MWRLRSEVVSWQAADVFPHLLLEMCQHCITTVFTAVSWAPAFSFSLSVPESGQC